MIYTCQHYGSSELVHAAAHTLYLKSTYDALFGGVIVKLPVLDDLQVDSSILAPIIVAKKVGLVSGAF